VRTGCDYGRHQPTLEGAESLTVSRIGDRTGVQQKKTAAATDAVEESYRQMTGQEKVEFTLLVRKELSDAVPGAIRTLARVANDGKPAQAAVAAARQIVLLAEKHGILKSSMDPMQNFMESLAAEFEGQDELRRED
jgi:hypothetical protein